MNADADENPRSWLTFIVYVIAAFLSFVESEICTEYFQSGFLYFFAVCVVGMFCRWGPLIPYTLVAFYICRFRPYHSGYAHNGMEIVEHDLIFPTIVAAFVAAGLIVVDLARRNEAVCRAAESERRATSADRGD